MMPIISSYSLIAFSSFTVSFHHATCMAALPPCCNKMCQEPGTNTIVVLQQMRIVCHDLWVTKQNNYKLQRGSFAVDTLKVTGSLKNMEKLESKLNAMNRLNRSFVLKA